MASQTHRILCLAYSRKHGGRCVAGLRLDGGGWIRPVSVQQDGTLTHFMCRLDTGDAPRLLDVIDIRFLRHKPLDYQPENWLIDRETPWKLVTRPATEKEWGIHEGHVVEGPDLFGDRSDRIPAGTPSRSSLALARVEDLTWVIREGSDGKRRTRVRFALGDAEYELGLTDDDLERRLRHLPMGEHGMRTCGLFAAARCALLTLSLGEPFQGNCYKLAAAVIGVE